MRRGVLHSCSPSLQSPLAPYVRAEGNFWESMNEEDAYVRPTEGTANSTLAQRGPGWSAAEEGEITNLDAQLKEAEALINSINAKRAALQDK